MINRWLQVFEKQGINGLLPKAKGRPTMKPKYPKMSPKPKADNLLQRDFTATQTNEKWTTDFTFWPRLVVSDDRLSKHTHGEWHSTEYVKEGKLFR